MDLHHPAVALRIHRDVGALVLYCGRSNVMNVHSCCRLVVLRHLVDVSMQQT
jgi:hypothetical protein